MHPTINNTHANVLHMLNGHKPDVKLIKYQQIMDDTLRNFTSNYAVTGHLHTIFDKFYNISFEERYIYYNQIYKITTTITKIVCKCKERGSYKLTNEEMEQFIMVIKQSSVKDRIITKIKYQPEKFVYTPKSIQQYSKKPKTPKFNRYKYDNHRYEYIKPQPYSKNFKLDNENVIFTVILSLITQLRENIMGSTINMLIFEYLETIPDMIREYYTQCPKDNIDQFFAVYEQYISLTDKIEDILKTHGWRLKTLNTNGGFKTDPNRLELLSDLETVINPYL